MDWLQALILGIVQGLAEYLPISSSGHLEIFREILHVNLPADEILEFNVMLHAATVLSTLVVLWKDFLPLCRSFFTIKLDSNFYYVCKILLSCIPVAIVGFCFKDFVESFFGGSLSTVGICLLITAALLTFAYTFRTRPLLKANIAGGGRDISWADAFIIGIAQAIAVLPGLSRSGTTIATGILLGDNREKVASFSFLMVIIPILGEAMLNVKDMLDAPISQASQAVGALEITIGFVAAFIVGCAACQWMLNIVKKGKLVWFAVYCAAVGILCIVW
ncbi:undecaprenyl-diphosphate phosphatase [uncultured Muribaculum sp.]|uniref:undecaprenyl-diphosphate phosphatase n=1 Tax=uncultured Muribaculum sp. TaxID=1918613 RepID=UPI002609117A|nr:undecaprenyl-diphosphate phosphatase [uncultured Muribaculum sp.]